MKLGDIRAATQGLDDGVDVYVGETKDVASTILFSKSKKLPRWDHENSIPWTDHPYKKATAIKISI